MAQANQNPATVVIGSLLGELFLHYCLLTVDDSPSPTLSLSPSVSSCLNYMQRGDFIMSASTETWTKGLFWNWSHLSGRKDFARENRWVKHHLQMQWKSDRWILNDEVSGFMEKRGVGVGLGGVWVVWLIMYDNQQRMLKWNSIQCDFYRFHCICRFSHLHDGIIFFISIFSVLAFFFPYQHVSFPVSKQCRIHNIKASFIALGIPQMRVLLQRHHCSAFKTNLIGWDSFCQEYPEFRLWLFVHLCVCVCVCVLCVEAV